MCDRLGVCECAGCCDFGGKRKQRTLDDVMCASNAFIVQDGALRICHLQQESGERVAAEPKHENAAANTEPLIRSIYRF